MNDVQGVSSTLEERRDALYAVLNSSTFARNPRLSALLDYICQRSLAGQTDSIKEFSIATDVFGRPADFDQSTDAIVRVEMHRLRRKLKEFYAAEGADQPIEIVVQSGHYFPEFIPRQKSIEAAQPERSITWSEPEIALSPARRSASRFSVSIPVLASLLLLVLLAAFALARLRFHTDPAPPIALAPSVGAVPAGEAIRILCGQSQSGFRDRQGNQWGPDAYFSGGTALESAAPLIYRTRNPQLFKSMRVGEFSYKIPLKPGSYELRLYFADTAYTPGPAMEGGENTRVFHVFLNGKEILHQFDIIADAGPATADIRVFKDVSPASDGYLHLDWKRVTDTPMVNAIEIVPGIPHHLRPVRIVTQDNTFTDHSGVVWSADDYFLGGRSIARYGTVVGPEDPLLYERERYGNFSYAIPVPPGHYTVKLYFAETYFGPNEPDGGGSGRRVFDVFCNGTALLRSFDMFREAGSHRQIIKTFHALEPNAQGKLTLTFIPHTNYANISALEVLDESE